MMRIVNMDNKTAHQNTAALFLVDDDPAFVRVLMRAMSRIGYAVWPAYSIAEARSALQTVRPDYAVIDLHLGDESGLDFLNVLQMESPETVSVILSGYLDIPSAVQAVKLGAVDCLAKPVDVEDLDACLKRVARKERTMPEKFTAPSKAKTQHILAHWEKNDRNTTKAAEVLGMHRRSLQRILIRAGFGRDRSHVEGKPSPWIKLRRLHSVWSGGTGR